MVLIACLAAAGCAGLPLGPKSTGALAEPTEIPDARWKEAKVSSVRAGALACTEATRAFGGIWQITAGGRAVRLLEDPKDHRWYWSVDIYRQPASGQPIFVPGLTWRTVDIDAASGRVVDTGEIYM